MVTKKVSFLKKTKKVSALIRGGKDLNKIIDFLLARCLDAPDLNKIIEKEIELSNKCTKFKVYR